ncbi:MAG TPA: ABC transporter permease, partial [bacterium]|nr:ABC transporter permease [bacterium]
LRLALSRLSPNTLYAEVLLSLLSPETRALGPVLITQLEGAVRGALPLSQSLLLAWPQFTGMIAAVLLLFAGTYVLFQRQEIRA